MGLQPNLQTTHPSHSTKHTVVVNVVNVYVNRVVVYEYINFKYEQNDLKLNMIFSTSKKPSIHTSQIIS